MKKLLFLLVSLCLIGSVNADLAITNGDFEEGELTANQMDVLSWYDANANSQSDASWWLSTWYGPAVSPNETSVMGLSNMDGTFNWAYQSIGVNDLAQERIAVTFNVGSFTDAGVTRDLGVTVAIYESDGTFTPEDNVDIDGAAGITLIDSASVLSTLESGTQTTQSVTLDLTSTGSGELFIRFINYAGENDSPWTAIDNVELVNVVPVEPADDPEGVNTVPVEQILEWDVILGGVDTVDVYLSKYDEPNLSYAEYKIVDAVPVESNTFTPENLEFSTKYYWKVVMNQSDGTEVSSPVWSFTTVAEVPTISAVNPPLTVNEAGMSVDLTVTGINVVDYQWYKVDSTSPLVDGADYSGVNTNTLTINDLQLADEGDYYCVVSNTAGSDSNQETGPGRVMTSRLVNHFTMDSASNGVITDIVDGLEMSLVSDDEDAIGLPAIDADVVDPAFTNSLDFANVAENEPNGVYTQLPEGSLFLEDMTISAWVKWEDNRSWQRIFDFGNNTTEYMFLSANAGSNLRFAMTVNGGGNEQQLNSGFTLPADTWTYVVVTLSGDTSRLYVDGELVDTNTSATIDPMDINPTLNYFGKSQYGDPYYQGKLDDVKIYNYALSTYEIAQDYLAVSGGWVCDNEVEALPYDYNNDCVIDIADFAIFTATWLDSNRIYLD